MADMNLAGLQSILESYAPLGRSGLLPALLDAQKEFGHISPLAAAEIGRALRVPLVDVYGVIQFYAMITTHPESGPTVRVCADPVCALKGADEVLAALSGGPGNGTAHTGSAGEQAGWANGGQVERVPCLGLCNHAPGILAADVPVLKSDLDRLENLFTSPPAPPEDLVDGPLQILTANCRQAGTTRLEAYRSGGGYQGLEQALALPPGQVITEVKAANLLGRGGAAFPAGIKWEAVAGALREPKYVVCNADESEPGSFKDRILLEKDPHRMLEGLLIAAYAAGAHYGYVYIRGEYARALTAVEQAVEEAHAAGLLGENIMGSGFNFEIELRQGAGAYICGEETALFESIEGRRGFPRTKPPFPTTHGLFGRPTVINNVETLCNVPFILTAGAERYRQIGTEKSSGPKLFCVSGDVLRPGLYEIPFGVTLRELLYGLAGGIPGGRRVGAVLLGGAAGAFALEQDLDVSLSFEDLQSAGLALGSGAVMVFDESRDLRDVLRRVGRFFQEESCGKCYPCQMGTQRQLEILERVAAGQALPGDSLRLADLAWTMTDASLCGLGQTAGTAVLSALKRFPELFDSAGGK